MPKKPRKPRAGIAAVPPLPKRLREGATGEDVALLQSALTSIGIDLADDELAARRFGPATREAVERLQVLVGMKPTGEVDPETLALAGQALERLQAHGSKAEDPAAGAAVVAGTVSDENGLPLAGATVVAFLRELRSSREVGRDTTGADGRYRIVYGEASPAEPGRPPTPGAADGGDEQPDLQLTVLAADGGVLYRSPVQHHVPRHAEIPLALGGAARSQPPELSRIGSAIGRRLGKLRPEELTEDQHNQDLSFLAQDTGLTRSSIAFYSVAARLANATELPAELFYALLRLNVPADAATVALATTAEGTDLEKNGQRLLQSILATSPVARREAVAAAIAGGIVRPDYARRANDDLAGLSKLAVSTALTTAHGMGKTPIATVLSAAAIARDKQEKFIALYTSALNPGRGFWNALAKNPEFTRAEVSTLRFATTIGLYSRGHMPLVDALLDMRRQGLVKGTRDLARLSAADWKALVLGQRGGKPIGIPANFTAQDQAQAVDAYAYLLERRFEQAHPSTAFSARLAEDTASPFAAKEAMVAFLDANPQFSLLRGNVDRYLKDRPKAVRAAERAALRESLHTSQRLLKLTSRYAVAKPLLADGIRSARQMYAMGRTRFIESYKDHADVGATQAARVYAVAEQTYALALSVAMNFHAPIVGVEPAAIGPAGPPAPAPGPAPAPPAPPPNFDDFPNLQTLFGSLDLCACKHCRSVLSPAAYFVDLLHFLSQRMTSGKSAKQVLLTRRPDLTQIELNCPNTHTVLPYIDLVNELLEDAVAPPADPLVAARARQTTLTTPELNANPEHVNQGAYAVLAGAVYPWGLPFDLPLAEARTYLGVLGTDRVTLTRTFRKPAVLGSPEGIARAVEGLGLSAQEADVVVGGPLAAGHEPWDYWGLAEVGNAVPDPVDSTTVHAGTWIDVLSHVRVLLHRSGLGYEALLELLRTVFVNPDGTVELQPGAADPCDLATMTIAGLSEAVLARIHRFVRLARRLGWPFHELDAAVALLQSGAPNGLGRLNTTLLRQLDAVKTAMKRFRLPVTTAVSLLARIDTRELPPPPGQETPRHSLYHNLFANRAVLNPVDAIFALNGGGTEIAAIAANPKLADHRATLVAAFELSDDDLVRAIDALTDGALTVANLSTLHRNVVLARGLGLSIKELLSLEAVVERETELAPFHERVDPFDPGRPELLGIFCDEVDRLRRTRFSITQLDYLLRHTFDATSGVAPDEVTVGTLLKSIRDKLLKVAAENAFGPDPTGGEVRRRLGLLLAPDDVNAAVAILDGTSSLSVADQGTLVADSLGPYMNVAATQAALVGGAALAAGAARYEYVLTRLLAHFRRTQGTSLVAQELADALGLPPATVVDLVTVWFQAQLNPGKALIEDFLALSGVARDPAKTDDPIARDEAGFAVYFGEHAALEKAAQLILGLGFTTEEAAWLRAHGVGEGWLDPTTLPLLPTASAEGRYARWRRAVSAAAVKGWLPSDGTPFTALMDLARDGADKASYFAALEKRTQWPERSLEALAGDDANAADRGLLELVYPDDYRSERALARLAPAFALLRRLGLPPDVSGWIGAAVTPAQADAVKQTVKAKYTTQQWASVAKPIRDVLRELQRDALVGYLLAHRPAGVSRWNDADDVYARYLIDVQMSACQGTSRIVQANAAVQLFVQRCILNLEPQVRVDANADADWLQWQWMSRYRVWEANRKVFLYPENWIQPELRREKSPFFKDLENELLQGEVTKDTAEEAFRVYLEKLDAVARLEVVGVYHEAADPSVFHVVARKQGNPPTYYYRRWIDSSRWTAWTKIDLDIVSDHVLPVVWNRRLFLFWAVVSRKPDRTQQNPSMQLSASTPSSARVHLEVQLAWSELKANKWLPTQTAPQTLVLADDVDGFEVTLKSSFSGPLLRIDLFIRELHFFYFDHRHFAEFVLGGVGNAVEAFVVSGSNLTNVGPETRGIGDLGSALVKGNLSPPLFNVYDGMALTSFAFAPLNASRPRVGPCSVTYDYYGSLNSEVVLERADRYRLVVPHQTLWFDSSLPFFYADSRRSYFAIPSKYYKNGNYFTPVAPQYVYRPVYKAKYRFAPFYHAFVPLFLRELNYGGVDRLFRRELQSAPATVEGGAAFDFKSYYGPTDNVIRPLPIEGVDFEPAAGYSIYNWELFFHAPFQIAESLRRNQRFDEAKHWYEYVFNPTSATSDPAPQRYWVTKPFYQRTTAEYRAQAIQNLMRLINQGDPEAEHQVAQWRANPFDPHIIAALRGVAYQRAIVMKYIDNLIEWGDHLFRQDTLESVNEATQLYVLAAELLGPRPQIVPRVDDTPAVTYADLEASLDDFANAVTAAENVLAPVKVNVGVDPVTPKLPLLPPLYFCIPPNEQLLAYWDKVADRLFKVRHCMNIEGVARQLALFAPPIDPGLLVKAVAAGLDLGSVLSDASAPLPPYRFRVILREALELAEQVRGLGSELLVCLEKRDADRLELLRSGSERKLQDRIVEVQAKLVEESDQQVEVLRKTRAVVQERLDHFDELKDSLMNTWEATSLVLTAGSVVAQGIALALDTTSGAAHAAPDAQFGGSGAGGSPHATVKYGGENVGKASAGWARAAKIAAAVLQTGAQMSAVVGGYQRRKEEWEFQQVLAGKELEQIDAHVTAASIRREIAGKTRDNHALVAESAVAVDEFLHDKFTNRELYEWMITQTSATYFQAYQLAFSVAKRAERCFRHELGLQDSSFVQFGYWDSLKKGLLTADKLLYDLRRIEAAYFEQHTRELELTRNLSLLAIDPLALVRLRSTGECTVALPELLFDLDNPGHYLRRLKSVGVTVPCVVGPHGVVPLTLTLLDSQIRTSSSAAPQYARLPGDDPRFVDGVGGIRSVVTSGGQNDSGLFEPRLDDERYLPFEGAGAVSTWKLRLNPVYPQFDYRTISDVVLQLRYTARDGGQPLAAEATNAVKGQLNAIALAENRSGLYRLISARQEHGTAWHKFLEPGAAVDQVLTIDTPPDRFPFFTNGLDIKVAGLDVMAKLSDPGDYDLVFSRPGAAAQAVALQVDAGLGGLHHFGADPLAPKTALGRAPAAEPYPSWTFKLRRQGAADFRSLAKDEIEDLVLILRYEVAP